MSTLTDIQIAKATAAGHVREAAKQQALVDRFASNPNRELDYIEAKRRLALHTAKAKEWAAEVERLEQERHAEIVADMDVL